MRDILGWVCSFVVAGLCTSAGSALAGDLFEQALNAVAAGDSAAAVALLPQLAVQQPDDAGAWLDMAVLYCSLGYTQQALAMFDAIDQRFSPPAGIRELMDLQRAGGCLPAQGGPGRGQLAWQVGRGHESNVNQGVRDLNVTLDGATGPLPLRLTPNYAARSDAFTNLALDGSWPVGTAGEQLLLDWQSRWYDVEHAFDVQALTVGALKPWRSGDWLGRWEASLDWIDLGGAMYQRTLGVRAWASPMGGPGDHWRAEMTGGWGRVNYPALAGFDASLWDVRTQLTYAGAGWATQASVAVLRDIALATRPGGNRRGWSIDGLIRWPVGRAVSAELGASVQAWQDAQVYSPGLIDERRHQNTVSGRAALVWRAGTEGQWVLEARQVRNNENIALFGYDALSVRLAYQRRWGQ